MDCVLEAIKCFWDPIWEYIDHHRKLEQHMNDLREKLIFLNIRSEDVKLKKEEALRHRLMVKNEVEKWFQDVQGAKTDMEIIEKKFHVVCYLLRGHLGESVCGKIEEVEKLHQQGCFPDGVAIDGPPAVGVPLLTPDLKGEIDAKERIWEYVMGDEFGMIGVCGMGGIGKTTIMKHINNQLLKDGRYEQVIWVTVSKELNIFKLQEGIANSLKESLPKDELQRATTLKDILEGKRYVLILDDVWQRFSLLDVGIVEPTLGVERKIVLTSRSIEVCKSMGCEVVKVQPLSKEESMNLFLNHVGHTIVQDKNLKGLVNKIVLQCGGLPLSIVAIAGSMKGVDDVCEWQNALNELKERVKRVKGSDIEIFEHLKFSYDRLEDPKIQKCFLYCSLYPEDFVIRKEELIESWMDEGLLEGLETRQAMHYRGHSILNKLENNCLLERDTIYYKEEVGVKMHDVLRDMAFYIKGHHFMVKSGMQLEEVPREQEWIGNVGMVSFMENQILEIPPHVSPKCPHLSTLILKKCGLKRIWESFFNHMLELKVLDLSHNDLVDLPESISNLKNLNALILHGCGMLKYVPSLAKLRALRKLDLGGTAIKEVPNGIEMLENLRYLDLRSEKLKGLPIGILPMIPRIQCLILKQLYVIGAEVGKLRKLEYVRCSFRNILEFKEYTKSIRGKWPTNFRFGVGTFEISPLRVEYGNSMKGVNFMKVRKVVRLCLKEERCNDIMVPHDLRSLDMVECHDFQCLSNVPWFREATDLRKCKIGSCGMIECVFDSSSSSCNALHTIEELTLSGLQNLLEVVRVGVRFELESTSHAPTPPAIFSSLKVLRLHCCPMVKKLFPVELLQGLQNLEVINVNRCEELEEIIASEENRKGEGTTFILPKLKSLKLDWLPKLKSICSGGVMIPTHSLIYLEICYCPELKRIPLLLPLDENGQPSSPPFLRGTVGPREWWESVKWDQPEAKNVLFVECFG